MRADLPAEFSRVGQESLPRLMSTVAQMDPIAPEAIARRLELGRQCFTAQVEGIIAAYGWLTRGPEYVGEFERELRVGEGEAYIWDCATSPGYRRQRLFSALLAHITACSRQEGIRRLWIIGVIAAEEINHGVAEAGFQPVMRLGYLRLDKRRLLALTPAREASAQELASARRLLEAEGDRAYGSLLLGNSARPRPPDTHFDG